MILNFEGQLPRQSIYNFIMEMKDVINQTGIRYSVVHAFTNENNTVTAILKVYEGKPAFIPQGAKPYSRPPSQRKRDEQRRQKFLKSKEQPPSPPPKSEHPGLGSTTQEPDTGLETASGTEKVYEIKSDQDAISLSRSAGYNSSDSSTSVRINRVSLRQERNRRRVRKVCEISVQTTVPSVQSVRTSSTQVTVDSRNVSVQCDKPLTSGNKRTLTINWKQVDKEIRLIRWTRLGAIILQRFCEFLRSESNDTRIPAYVAFLIKAGCNRNDVGRVMKHLPSDVDSEALISLLALLLPGY